MLFRSIDKMLVDGTFETLAKRERLQVTRQRAKLEKNLGSIADLNRLPAALFVIDVQKEMNAVKEAIRLNIPVIAMVDTCCDPTPIDYVIPANDDAAKSIQLVLGVLSEAVREGLSERKLEKDKEGDAPEYSEDREEVAAPKMRARKTGGVKAKEAAPKKEAAEANEPKAEAPVSAPEAPVAPEAAAPEAAEEV